MTHTRTTVRAAALAALALTATVTACGRTHPGGNDAGGNENVAAVATTGTTPAATAPARTATPTAGPRPPGDPGPDAPSAPDPGAPSAPDTAPPKLHIPAGALLNAGSVAEVLGRVWQPAAIPPDSCAAPRPAGALAARSVALKANPRAFFETVSVYRTRVAAVAAVAAAKRRLSGCGWTIGVDSGLGEASMVATRSGGAERVGVIAAEGLAVTLVTSSGSASGVSVDAWDALSDLALGSSCPAAPDGCH